MQENEKIEPKAGQIVKPVEPKKSVEETLAGMAKRGCSHCYGRGFEGWKIKNRIIRGKNIGTYKEYMPCRCVLTYENRLKRRIETLKCRLRLRQHNKMPYNKMSPKMIAALARKKNWDFQEEKRYMRILGAI